MQVEQINCDGASIYRRAQFLLAVDGRVLARPCRANYDSLSLPLILPPLLDSEGVEVNLVFPDGRQFPVRTKVMSDSDHCLKKARNGTKTIL